MNALVVYDSKFGNTERIARAIAGALGRGSSVRVHAVSDGPFPIDGVDLLVLGGPTQAHGMSAPMRAFLGALPAGTLLNVRAATFDTRFHIPQVFSGSAASTIARTIKKQGAQVVVPAESFFIGSSEGPLKEGELERAQAWATDLLAAVGAPGQEVVAGRS
ncbi:MAG TPA: hypothetical protein VF898_05340 [Chloroflexota bacterium]